jgi:hypothetical protein
VGIAREQDPVRQLGRGLQVDRKARVTIWKTKASMARTRTPQDALRDAVERTIHAGEATREQARTRAQGAVDELGRAAARLPKLLEGGPPATQDDVKAIRKELRSIVKRLDKIEDRLSKKAK